MNLEKIFREEDLFPREFVNFEAREYGILFYDEINKDSYDSNHAVIFSHKILDLDAVLADVTAFYKKKGQKSYYLSGNGRGRLFCGKCRGVCKAWFQNLGRRIAYYGSG